VSVSLTTEPAAARLQVLVAAVLFSTGGAGIKVDAFSAAQVSMLRSGIAAVALLLWARGRVAWSGPAVGAGVIYAAMLTLFVTATKLTTAANAIFLQATAPLYVMLLAPWLLRERFQVRDAGYLAALVLGLALCFAGQSTPTATAPNPSLGNLFGVLSGLVWALTLIALRYVGRSGERSGAVTAVFAGNAFACVGALPFAWPLPPAPVGQWATLVYLGVFQIGLAYVLLTHAVRHLPALDVSLLLLMEPVLNPVWTWLVRGEEPGRWTIAGGAAIVIATGFKTLRTAR
jgi:drug/metabolite transporter (DMT)-like permease